MDDAELRFVLLHDRFVGIEPRRGGGWIVRISDDGHEMRFAGDTLEEVIASAAEALRQTGRLP